MTSRTFAAPIDLEGYVVAGIKPTSTGSEISVTSEDEEKDLFKKQETVKGQAQKESTEKAALTKNLNYLLVQAYKGKIDKIFGNLRVNIDKYPAEVQIRIFKQVSESVAVKLQMIEEKGESLGPNRKEVLGSVLEYIQSLVSADIARVKKEK
jgi:hypothetical protein